MYVRALPCSLTDVKYEEKFYIVFHEKMWNSWCARKWMKCEEIFWKYETFISGNG